MKLVTYKSGTHPEESVFYTSSGVRLNKDAPTAVEDDDVPELKGHKFEVSALRKSKDVSAGDVIRDNADEPETPTP